MHSMQTPRAREINGDEAPHRRHVAIAAFDPHHPTISWFLWGLALQGPANGSDDFLPQYLQMYWACSMMSSWFLFGLLEQKPGILPDILFAQYLQI
jgi:hypothetical protein